MRFIDQEEMLHWERAPYNALILRDAGIPFAFTTSGLESTDELFSTLRKLRSKGIPENLILESLTSIPASFLGMEHQIGQIAAGYEAHFFITSGDIFIDEKAELRTHYIRGKAYQVKAAPAVLLPGKYDLNVDNLYLELQVGGKHPEYEAQVQTISGSDTTTWKATLSLLGHELSLAFMAPDSSGTYRLSASARSENRIWDGMGKNPEGLDIEWSGIRKVEKSPSPKNGNESKTKNGIGKSPAKSTPTDAISISAPTFPAMRYPMCAYGFDSIPDTETLLISNATVWTNTSEGKLKNAQVLMHNGKILALGQNLNPEEWLPKKTIESLVHLDATGMHLTPGIVDEHSHIAISRGVNEGTQAVTSEVRIADALNPSDINIFRQLSGGVTTSQLLHGSANPIGGQSAVIKLRWGQPYSAMVFAEAPQFIKFALGENVKQTNWGDKYTSRYPQTRMGVEQIFYDYFYRAKNYSEKLTLYQAAMEAQNEGRKKRKASPTPVFRRDLELEALLEILNGTRHITCHSYVQSEINMLMHVADSMGFKVNTFTHILEGYKIADKLAAHGAAGSSFSDWWAYKYEVRDAIPYNGTLMHNAGVLVGFNSDDAEMARRLNQEAAKAIKYGGMSEENALKLVTLNPAKMMHIDHLVGSIAPGMHADLVLWNGHPLSVYSSAQVTFVDGIRYFDRSRLEDLMRRDQADRARIADLMRAAKAGGEESQKPERKMERYYHCTDIEEQ
jgi:imidazolonepropionase-like amidohydrolase